MKKLLNISKISILSAVFAAAILVPSVSAKAASLNMTLRAVNSTVACTSCAWNTTVSADAGNIVTFLFTYNNNSGQTATQTKASISLPSASFTSSAVPGSMFAQNAASAIGSVTVNLSSNQTIAYVPNSAKWYPNGATAAQPLLYGQNGSEVVTAAGLNIGDIANGNSGYVEFTVSVSTNSQNGNNGGSQTPIVTTNAATNINQTSATLNGAVNANGSFTNAWFEYGTTQSLGTNTGNVSSGLGSLTPSTTLSVLSANTTYYYRVGAQNSYGTSYGSIMSFITNSNGQGSAPAVFTGSATSANQNSLTFNGTANPNNSNTTIWFEYGTTQSLGYTVGNQSIGNGNTLQNITVYASNLLSNTVYYYRIVAQNGYGTSYGGILNTSTQNNGNSCGYGINCNGVVPLVSTNYAVNINQYTATLNGTVNPNGYYTTTWFEWGPTYSLGNIVGNQSIGSGNYTQNMTAFLGNLSPNTTYYFRIGAQNNYGTNYGSILSFTTLPLNYSYNNSGQPLVTTVPATFIYQNSALLNGTVNPNGYNGTAWFEWGATNSLGNKTDSQTSGQGTVGALYSFALTGLQPNTTYYYRAVSQNTIGISYGDIMNFATAKTTASVNSNPTVYIQNPIDSGSKTSDLVSLTPAVDNLNPSGGDEITYTLVYRNNSKSAVTNTTLKLTLPNEVTYEISNPQTASVNGNTLSFDLGTINSQSQGIISVKSKIANSTKANSALVFSGILTYTDSADKAGSINAYLAVVVKQSASVTASLIDVIGYLFNSQIFDLIIGLVLGYGTYLFFVKRKESAVK